MTIPMIVSRYSRLLPVFASLVCSGVLLNAQTSAPASPAAPQSPASPAAPAAPAAKSAPAQQAAFYVVGITVRTSGAAEAGGQGGIGGLWQRFMQEETLSTIPNQLDQGNVYVVYTDFGPEPGSYTYLLGAKVSSIDHVPAGMVAKQVPAGRYAIVPSETGPLPQVVPAVWQKIMRMTPEELGGTHSFKADYEVYSVQGLDPSNAQVNVHIGLQ